MNDIAHDILERAANGDMAAFEQIYKAASSFVYNVALRITCNSADAEEVAQDVFMRIYHHLKDFQFSSTFKTWIYRITVNAAINHYRKHIKERRARVNNEHVLDLIPANLSTDEKALQGDYQTQLDQLLKALNPEHRACLVLREIEGLNYQEMATVLRIPVNTVRSRLKRARQSLLDQARKETQNDVPRNM